MANTSSDSDLDTGNLMLVLSPADFTDLARAVNAAGTVGALSPQRAEAVCRLLAAAQPAGPRYLLVTREICCDGRDALEFEQHETRDGLNAAVLKHALRFCEGYVLPHAVACAARVSGSAIDADADAVLAYLSTKGPTDLRSLRAHFRSWGLAAVNDRRTRFDAAVATLVSRSDVKLEGLPRKRFMVHVLRGGAS